jgi:hypothetical protein
MILYKQKTTIVWYEQKTPVALSSDGSDDVISGRIRSVTPEIDKSLYQ